MEFPDCTNQCGKALCDIMEFPDCTNQCGGNLRDIMEFPDCNNQCLLQSSRAFFHGLQSFVLHDIFTGEQLFERRVLDKPYDVIEVSQEN